jgi:hypothetical protein
VSVAHSQVSISLMKLQNMHDTLTNALQKISSCRDDLHALI